MRIVNGFKVNPILITKNNLEKLNAIKILFIPSAFYMTSDEIESISQYLERGVVVADYMPGVVNETDNDLPTKIIEHLNNRDVIIQKEKGNKIGYSENIILLGGILSQEWKNIPQEKVVELVNSIREVLNKNKVRTIYGEEIKGWCDAKFYSYENGRVIGYLPNLCNIRIYDEVNIDIQSGKEGWIYDLESSRVLKKGKNISIKTERLEPIIFTSLPYQVKEIAVKCPKSVRTGERIPIEIEIKKGKSGDKNGFVRHIIYVRMSADKEMKDIIHAELVETDNEGKANLIIPTYINQPAGWYFLEITDFYSICRKSRLIKIIP